MKQLESNMQSSLPFDIAFKIVSSLQVSDVCSLACCSSFWRELCGSDPIWESLTRDRWPLVSFVGDSNLKGWREVYKRMHREMKSKAASVVEFVEQCSASESLEVGDYYKAVEDLVSMRLALGDVQMFLFKPMLSVLVNLAWVVMDALLSCKISERQVCVKWWKLGRWFYGFRMRDESRSCWLSLGELVTVKGEEVLGVLRRGAIHEVIRVEISSSNTTFTPWSYQNTLMQY